MIISERIAELRKQCGLTQEQLGQKVGVSSQAVSKWENGGAPDVELLPTIARVLGVSLDELFGQEGGPVSNINHTVTQYLRSFPSDKRIMEMYKLFTTSVSALGVPEKLASELDGLINISKTAWYDTEGEENPSFLLRSLMADDSGAVLTITAEDFPLFMLLPEPEGGYEQNFADKKEYQKLFKLLGQDHVLDILLWMAKSKPEAYITTSVLAKGCDCKEEITQQLLEEMEEIGLLSCIEIQTEKGTQKVWQQRNAEALIPFLYSARWLLQKKALYFYSWNVREKPWLSQKGERR